MFFQPFTHRRALIDCNSFFASCEVLRNPSWRGKPVCVGRDIVLAATYEAKRYGVKTGTPVREAKKILPKDAIYVSGEMKWYGQVSQRLMAYLKKSCPHVFPASIDEAFLDLSQEAERDWQKRALQLKKSIFQDVGIPVSIGVSVSKILAKLSAEQHKPFGELAAMSLDDVELLLKHTGLRDVCFLGEASVEKLSPFCSNPYEFTQLPRERVQYLLGTHGLKIWHELRGVSLTMRSFSRRPKSISRTRSFNPHFTSDKQKLWSYLLTNVERAWRELRESHLQTARIKVFLKAKSFRKYARVVCLPQPTDTYETICTQVRNLFEDLYTDRVLWRTTGVGFRELSDARHKQASLFESTQDTKKQEQIDDVVASLNEKFGTGTIGRGKSSFVKKAHSRLDDVHLTVT